MNPIESVKPFGDPARSEILVIGHDPRLRKSDTVAQYSLFADYHFRPRPIQRSEVSKYNLAASVYKVVRFLTDGLCSPEQVLVTNLCNEILPKAPKNKIVLIPKETAHSGIIAIHNLIEGSAVRVILPMSQQVNYWLQYFGFYSANAKYMKDATPTKKGQRCKPPYYEAQRPGAFKLICGRKYNGPNKTMVFPILHTKNWPLREPFKSAYEPCYLRCSEMIIDEFKRFRVLAQP